MSSGAKRNRDISDFSGRLRFLAALGMTLGLGEIFNAQYLEGLELVLGIHGTNTLFPILIVNASDSAPPTAAFGITRAFNPKPGSSASRLRELHKVPVKSSRWVDGLALSWSKGGWDVI